MNLKFVIEKCKLMSLFSLVFELTILLPISNVTVSDKFLSSRRSPWTPMFPLMAPDYPPTAYDGPKRNGSDRDWNTFSIGFYLWKRYLYPKLEFLRRSPFYGLELNFNFLNKIKLIVYNHFEIILYNLQCYMHNKLFCYRFLDYFSLNY